MTYSHFLALFGKTLTAGLILAASWGWQPPEAAADAQPAPRFAIIDVQQVLRESEAVISLNREIEKLRTAYQGELREKEEDLRGADQELSRQRTVISDEVFAQKRQALEAQVSTLQREVQGRKRALDRTFSTGLAQVQAELAKVAKAIAEERGLDLIFSKATVVIVKPEFEITAEASKRLNQRLPSVAVQMPQK